MALVGKAMWWVVSRAFGLDDLGVDHALLEEHVNDLARDLGL